ncbi:hypothetical protein AVEN_148826-1 [Araneus ventricosus]|uniref:Uncharacterized protein n=1 Tax=Araneus ventricosus TaxID=182803 RepID=A0A4Y2XAE1_ARAVE|nr:hypothetical protein AVEN_148826-1 [Araneus ventricosus]
MRSPSRFVIGKSHNDFWRSTWVVSQRSLCTVPSTPPGYVIQSRFYDSGFLSLLVFGKLVGVWSRGNWRSLGPHSGVRRISLETCSLCELVS